MFEKETGARLFAADLPPEPLNTLLKEPPEHPERSAAPRIIAINVKIQLESRPAAALRKLNTKSDSVALDFPGSCTNSITCPLTADPGLMLFTASRETRLAARQKIRR